MGDWTLKRNWRFLETGPGTGAWNMALDEALFQTVKAGGPPFFRFYSWNPATLSLGRFQNLSTGLTPEALAVPMVRRPTGGGAIWHAAELTYSLGCTQEDLGPVGVKASFELLGSFLLEAWRQLGWNAVFAKDSNQRSLGAYTPACFAGSEEYDILVGGKKLGGNAQRRDRRMIFQHGSIPVRLDHGRLEQLFLPGYRPAPESVTDLESNGWNAPESELRALLAESFQQRLAVEWKAESPSQPEEELARGLAEGHYGDSSWTNFGTGNLRKP